MSAVRTPDTRKSKVDTRKSGTDCSVVNPVAVLTVGTPQDSGYMSAVRTPDTSFFEASRIASDVVVYVVRAATMQNLRCVAQHVLQSQLARVQGEVCELLERQGDYRCRR
jgi:hypothetical protein